MLYAKVDTAASGDTTVIAAKTNYRIRVVSYLLVATSAVTAEWYDGASSGNANLTGAMTMATGTPIHAAPPGINPGGQMGHFETTAGNALVLKLGGAVQVSGHVAYEYVR